MSIAAIIMAMHVANLTSNHYVYKMCEPHWIVVMEKLPNTLTTEHRTTIFDHNHAKFRANMLNVLQIINIFNVTDQPNTITNTFGSHLAQYTVNQIVYPDAYEINPNIVFAGGIHYFCSLETAFYYRCIDNNFTGLWRTWHDNGRIKSDCEYVNGKLHGYEKWWYENGQQKQKSNYVNGKLHGYTKVWYENGHPLAKGNFVDGKVHGYAKIWHKNGQLDLERIYANGNLYGRPNWWYEFGQSKIKSTSSIAKPSGYPKNWYESCQPESKCDYVN